MAVLMYIKRQAVREKLQTACPYVLIDALNLLSTNREGQSKNYLLFLMYSSIAFAACLPAPIARITVAAPVTASPPA